LAILTKAGVALLHFKGTLTKEEEKKVDFHKLN